MHSGHLWFLFYLFVFSLVSLNMFVNLKTAHFKDRRAWVVNRFSGGRSIFLPMVPLMIVEIALRWLFPGFQTFVTDWANVFHYWLLFVFGFLLFSDDRFRQAIAVNKRLALWIGVPVSVGYCLIIPLSESAFRGFTDNPSAGYLADHPETIGYYILMMVLKVVGEWCWLIMFLGYTRQYLSTADGKVIRYLSNIALPFYILHQTIVLIIGFYVVQTTFPIVVKYLIINLTAFPLIFLACAMAGTNRMTRFIFGMK